MLGSLITFGSWLSNPIYHFLLFIDGIIYSLVAYSYKLFIIMTQLNYNVLYNMMEPLIDRIKALIIVFIMFKIGCALMSYLVNPEKINDGKVGGKALVINLLVAAGILGIYGFVFSLANDISMLMLGSISEGDFRVLDSPSDKSGLIARFVFGSNSSIGKADNFGKYLAITTLNMFLHSDPNSNSKEAEKIYDEILTASDTSNGVEKDDDFDLMKITELADDIGRTVQYRYPVLSGIMGFYLIYSIVKIALEVGVRMFKLTVLQIIAPIPIISIVSDGVSGGMFKKYCDLLIATIIEVFIRTASLYIVVGFIASFYQQIMGTGTNTSLFGEGYTNISFFTKTLVIIIVIVAGFRFVNTLPDFLKKIFGDIIPDTGKGSFGKFFGGMVGGAIAGGVSGGFGGALAGAANGAYNGEKGKKISESVKSASDTGKEVGKSKGGLLGYGLNKGMQGLGLNEVRNAGLDRDISKHKKVVEGEDDKIQKLQEQNASIRARHADAADKIKRGSTLHAASGRSYQGVTSSSDLAQRMKAEDTTLSQAKFKMAQAEKSGDDVAYASAFEAYNNRNRDIETEADSIYTTEMDRTLTKKSDGTFVAGTYRDEQTKTLDNDKSIAESSARKNEESKVITKREKAKEKGILHK